MLQVESTKVCFEQIVEYKTMAQLHQGNKD